MDTGARDGLVPRMPEVSIRCGVHTGEAWRDWARSDECC